MWENPEWVWMVRRGYTLFDSSLIHETDVMNIVMNYRDDTVKERNKDMA